MSAKETIVLFEEYLNQNIEVGLFIMNGLLLSIVGPFSLFKRDCECLVQNINYRR
jgi:hypothetical protein